MQAKGVLNRCGARRFRLGLDSEAATGSKESTRKMGAEVVANRPRQRMLLRR